jgi:hypothetical protein
VLVRVSVIEARGEKTIGDRLARMSRAFWSALLNLLVGSFFAPGALALASCVGEAAIFAFSAASFAGRIARIVTVIRVSLMIRTSIGAIEQTLNPDRI